MNHFTTTAQIGRNDKAKWRNVTRAARSRQGASLIEVLAGTTLAALLVPVILGTLGATQRLWHQFDSGRDATGNRQSAMQEFERRITGARRILAYTEHDLRFEDSTGQVREISAQSQRGSRNPLALELVETVNGRPQTIAEGIGPFQITLVEQSPAAGELLQVRIDNLADPVVKPNRSGTLHSARLVWKRP